MKTLDVVSLMQYIVVSPHASGVIVPPGHMWTSYMSSDTKIHFHRYLIYKWSHIPNTYIPSLKHRITPTNTLANTCIIVCLCKYLYFINVCECSTQSQLWFIIHFVVLTLIIQMFCKSSLTVSCHHIWVSGSGVTITASRRYLQRQSPARACGDMDLSSV